MVDTSRPLCGYRRLTVDRFGNKVGYEVQTTPVEAWAKANGLTIGHWYEDRDLTAADLSVVRPDYEQMLIDIKAGMWSGVACWRLDRLVRLTREFERCNGIVQDANAIIAVVSPSLIRSDDPIGALFMRLMVLMAQMEIDTMKARIRANIRHRAEHGKFHGGGYRRFGFEGARFWTDEEEWTLSPDEKQRRMESGPINKGRIGVTPIDHEFKALREAAERISNGEASWTDVIDEWNYSDPPLLSARGKPWTITTLREILLSKRAIGKREAEVFDEDTGAMIKMDVDAQWPAIIDEETQERLRLLFGPRQKRGPMDKYLLTNIATCGNCGMLISAGGDPRRGQTYQCKKGSQNKKRGSCGSVSIRRDLVDEIVTGATLRRIRETRGVVSKVEGAQSAMSLRLEAANKTIERCEAKLLELSAQLINWTMAQVNAARAPIEKEKADAEAVARSLTSALQVPVPSKKDFENLNAWFYRLNHDQRRALVSKYVTVTIMKGQAGIGFNPGRVVVAPAEAKDANGERDEARVVDAN